MKIASSRARNFYASLYFISSHLLSTTFASWLWDEIQWTKVFTKEKCLQRFFFFNQNVVLVAEETMQAETKFSLLPFTCLDDGVSVCQKCIHNRRRICNSINVGESLDPVLLPWDKKKWVGWENRWYFSSLTFSLLSLTRFSKTTT